MIIEYIERLRKEPKEVRRQAVFIWTVALVLVIALIYIAVHFVADFFPDAGSTNTIAAPYESGAR